MAICNKCNDGLNEDNGLRCEYCGGTGYYPSDDDIDYNEDDNFQRCSKCDGHDACEDFGCAFKLGLGRMINREVI